MPDELDQSDANHNEIEITTEALEQAIGLFIEICNRCNFVAGTLMIAQDGGAMNVDHALLKEPEKMTDKQKRAIIIGMRKVHAAFDNLGWPNLDVYSSRMFQPFSFKPIYFEELSDDSRFEERPDDSRRGMRVSLLNDSEIKITKILQMALESAFLDPIAARERSKMRSLFHGL